MIVADAPPPVPQSHQEFYDASFRPGYLNQDVFTLPIEVGLIASLNYFYNPRSKTLFPLFDEDSNQKNHATTYTRSALLPYAVGAGALVFAGLHFTNDNFPLWMQARGFAHALLLSEVAGTSAKVIFQKKRPNYNAQVNGSGGNDTFDSRASFYSGHANQAFAFSTYSSLLMFRYSNSIAVSAFYSAAAFAASSIVSYSRVEDYAHNLSDVIVGAIMGATISGLTFFRVQEVEAQMNKQAVSTEKQTHFEMTPGMMHDDFGKTWYMANMSLDI